MTFAECEKRNIAILENAKLWAFGNPCEPLRSLDVEYLAAHYSIRLSKSFSIFIKSDKAGHYQVEGRFPNQSALRSISRTLATIKEKLAG